MEQFQNDLLASLRQMKTGKAAQITNVNIPSVVAARNTLGLSQSRLAEFLGVSKRTISGVGTTNGVAKTLLHVVERHPEVLRELSA